MGANFLMILLFVCCFLFLALQKILNPPLSPLPYTIRVFLQSLPKRSSGSLFTWKFHWELFAHDWTHSKIFWDTARLGRPYKQWGRRERERQGLRCAVKEFLSAAQNMCVPWQGSAIEFCPPRMNKVKRIQSSKSEPCTYKTRGQWPYRTGVLQCLVYYWINTN